MKHSVISLLLIAIASISVVSCNDSATVTKSDQPLSKDSLVARGKYLVTTMGCGDCHHPKKMGPMGPEPDTSLLFSGQPAGMPVSAFDTTTAKSWILMSPGMTAFVGPWGVSFSANISSDSTGIGLWTEEQFGRAMREGKSKGLAANRTLLPPMPWPNFRTLSDADLSAMFAYLKSTKPIKNLVPSPIPPGHKM